MLKRRGRGPLLVVVPLVPGGYLPFLIMGRGSGKIPCMESSLFLFFLWTSWKLWRVIFASRGEGSRCFCPCTRRIIYIPPFFFLPFLMMTILVLLCVCMSYVNDTSRVQLHSISLPLGQSCRLGSIEKPAQVPRPQGFASLAARPLSHL